MTERPGDDGATRTSADQQRLPDIVKLLSEVASLVAFATALLYYFGWRRSEAQARAFGADASVFAMSTQDLVLRSLDVLLLPLVALLLLALVGIRLHRRLVGGRHVHLVATVLRKSWLLPIGVGVPLLLRWEEVGVFSLPFWVALAVIGTWYGVSLDQRTRRNVPPTPFVVVLVFSTLTALCLFWVTERVAFVVGEARADDIQADVGRILPGVTVYSGQRMHLGGAGVTETDLGDPEAAYRYRYDGLHLLQRSGSEYFLVSRDWTDERGRLVVLPDDATVRMEFGPGR